MRGRVRRRLYWEDDPHFDLFTHLRRYALPSPGDENSLREVVGRLVSAPLHPGMPLWQLHLIEGYRGRDALLARIHHCIADGMGLMRVLLSLTGIAIYALLNWFSKWAMRRWYGGED